jgi:hypothetical protein
MSRLHAPSLPANRFVYRETPPKQRFMKYPAGSLDQSANRMLIKVKSM